MDCADEYTAAEEAMNTAEIALLPKHTLVVCDGAGWTSSDVEMFNTSIKFYRAVQRDKSIIVKAVTEEWSMADIVRFLN